MEVGQDVTEGIKMAQKLEAAGFDGLLDAGSASMKRKMHWAALMSEDGTLKKLATDTVALAIGMIPETRLADALDNCPHRVYRMGDCRSPKNVMNAVWDAYEIARFI